LGLAAPVWGQADDEALWRDFLKWYESRPVEDTNPRVSYLEELKRRGVAAAEVERRGALLERLTQTRWLELMPRFFDRTYKSGAPRFNPEPNAWLVENVKGLAPGRALDVDMGQGRNAVFLARAGWAVTGFDSSKEGVAVARRAARAAGVKLTAVVEKHEDFDYGRERWDLVVMTYAWVDVRGPLMRRIVDSLKPGGRLVYEQMVEMSGGEGAAPWLPRPGEAARIFTPLRVLRNEEVTARADWSWRPERLVRLVAEKQGVS
jgi:SAM-dependent methyltransferase